MSEITTIRFDGDNLQTVHEGERVWVVVKRVCEALGVDYGAQHKRLSDAVSSPWATVSLTETVAEDGKTRELFCVDLDTLPMWLATIAIKRVAKDKPEAREKLIAYQKECARVLRDHFFGRAPAQADLAAIAAVVSQVVSAQLAPVVAALTALAETLAHANRQLAWLVTNTGPGGAISDAQRRQLQAEVRSIGALEVASGRHKNTRAASADIYREMGSIVAWGGKGQPWSHLPAPSLQPALAVLASRRKDVEKRLCAAGNVRQLSIAQPVPANDNAKR
jgi:hypothetical protein